MCQCSQRDGVYGPGEMQMDFELMAGVAGGAVVGNFLDPMLEKVDFIKDNAYIGPAIKIAGGALLSASMGQDNSLLNGVGMGLLANGAMGLANSIFPAGGSGERRSFRVGKYQRNRVDASYFQRRGQKQGIPQPQTQQRRQAPPVRVRVAA